MDRLSHLTVSLTKHGAHKIATLLSFYDIDDLLDHTTSSELRVDINRTMVAKIMSASDSGSIPGLWNTAKSLGPTIFRPLVALAIIFSHHSLIELFAKKHGSGTIDRSELDGDKAFTNLRNNLSELGLIKSSALNSFEFNISNLVEEHRLGPLVFDLLKRKIELSTSDRHDELIKDIEELSLNNVFGTAPTELLDWFRGETHNEDKTDLETIDFFTTAPKESENRDFLFTPGHTTRKEGYSEYYSKQDSTTRANLLHNQIQNKLYDDLCKDFGIDSVGTEHPTGSGTAIDILVKNSDNTFDLYEIKTASSPRLCVRQAIPQLLEYSFWNDKKLPINRLVVVAPNNADDQTFKYLELLRKEFNLPIYYEAVSIDG